MATAAVTTTFVNGVTADATQVNTNFTDLVTFLNTSVVHTDGSKALTAPVTGVAPTSDLHLSTRRFADTGTITFSQAGDLAVGTGAHRFYLPYGVSIVEVIASVGTAPTGAAIILDVNKNGTTIWTTQANRLSIVAGGFVAATNLFQVAAGADGDYYTVDIDQVGSTIAGADLVVTIHYRRT